MSQIVPAILSNDLNEVQDKLNLLTDVVEWAQIDLMDGKFVNNKSITPEELLQIKTTLSLEAHLMVADPEAWLPSLNPDIFKRVYFHIEAVPAPDEMLKKVRQMGFEVGIAINIETPLSAIQEWAEYVDGVLFMSVKPGWQNQEFHPEVVEKIKEFEHEYPDTDISIDGGINESNIFEVASAGVNNICVGSAIFASGDLADNLQKLKDQMS
ncbi:MAG: ribulose-phosphate 3-epimerase [Patescibacteria group bacterium]|jgi:ribulose-phosphate 3-epimerase